jgi:uncharacterized repeat protein (TIGR03803 family)
MGERWKSLGTGFAGVLLIAVFIAAPSAANAGRFTTLYSFCKAPQDGLCPDGEGPASRLLKIDNLLYGTATVGGPTQESILYSVSTTGTFSTVYTFCNVSPCSGTTDPGGFLARGTAGSFYGVTNSDGTADGGTIFQVSASQQLTTLYQFCARLHCLDGSSPVAVISDHHGELLGTTAAGGAYRQGTVFRFRPGGRFRVIHNFCSATNCADGNMPGVLLLAHDGNFYGTTSAGGTIGAGTVFQISSAGNFRTLYSFCSSNGCVDGEYPGPTLVEGADGNLYGITNLGGTNGRGTIYTITTDGRLKTLYAFCSRTNCADGESPQEGLALAPNGGFYGVASGGIYFHGLVFKITPAGTYSTVHNFCTVGGCFDGANPAVEPTITANGTLYGTTTAGGHANLGTVYVLKP